MYQRFEASVAFLLTLVIGAVIVVALYRLMVSVIETLVLKSLNPLDHSVFQQVFGEIMTLLIALEFNHTLHYVITVSSSCPSFIAVAASYAAFDLAGPGNCGARHHAFGVASVTHVAGLK
jgi:uncharacterized membrane protein (DUF373 family)